MLTKKQKLELTWIGKENRPRLEPRILLEDPDLSYHAAQRVADDDLFDNRLIFGDNLLALKALENEFRGRFNCIYVDPPFNTGQAFEHYDDSLEHSYWLALMRDRLEILFRLLAPNGLLWVHLDDSEVHYCKVILDEICSRSNFVANITYERSGAAGLGQGGFIVNTGENLLLYKKEVLPETRILAYEDLEARTMTRYNKALVDEGSRQLVDEFTAKSNGLPVRVYKHSGFKMESISLARMAEREAEIRREFAHYFSVLFRTNQIQKENEFQRDLVGRMEKQSLYTVDYIPSRGRSEGKPTTLYYYNAELFAWLRDTAQLDSDGQIVKASNLTNVWAHAEIPKADIANEGGVDFPRGKKPERLLQRILEMSTEPGDWVLDSFAGSGTTGAVAHKMGRRWVMVELGEHCHSHIIPRLTAVVNGTDARGITRAVSWNGGGGFRYFRLAPSLMEKDAWGNWVINKQYKGEMLSEAICKLEGFTYCPSDAVYWQHGYSTERDFIYVTTASLTHEQLQQLSEEVGPERTLLVVCSAFRGALAGYENLTVKKIPNAVLNRCEWGHDDYSLRVENLPKAPVEPTQPLLLEEAVG